MPTIGIDGKYQSLEIPDFPWMCGGDDLYKKLKMIIH